MLKFGFREIHICEVHIHVHEHQSHASQFNVGKFQKHPVPKIVTDAPGRETRNYTRKDWMLTCYSLV